MIPTQKSHNSQSIRGRLTKRRHGYLAGAILWAVGAFVPHQMAAADVMSLSKSLPGTPLVLKDGRIARVSIHNIPFPEDADALASKTAIELETFTQTVATDCFLTAQVIGHVDKAETSGRDTVEIHRLARARADTIQNTLIGNGLPAESIASVWDWQFIVQDARATLWVFQLISGDDCENETLSPASSGQVAKLDQEFLTNDEGPAAAGSANAEARTTQQRVIKAAKATAAEPVQKEAVTANQAIKSAARPSTSAPTIKKPIQLTAVTTPSDEADEKGRVVVAPEGLLEVTFATNSSYFPQGWSEPLRSFLDQLEEGQNYTVQVQTSIDNGATVAGASSTDEAAQYNEWLATRRFERVKAWLLKNSNGSELEIEPTRVENDGSRRVVVKLTPYG